MDKAARRILWGSYLFQFWISGADFVQDQEGDQPLPLCILMGGRLGREKRGEGFQSLLKWTRLIDSNQSNDRATVGRPCVRSMDQQAHPGVSGVW